MEGWLALGGGMISRKRLVSMLEYLFACVLLSFPHLRFAIHIAFALAMHPKGEGV